MHLTFNLLVCRRLVALSCILIGSVVSSEEYAALPPKGIEVPQAKLDELASRIEKLQSQLNQSRGLNDGQRRQVEVFVRAASLAMEQGLFYQPKDIDHALRTIEIGAARLQAAKQGASELKLLAIGSQKASNISTACWRISIVDR